MKQPVTSGILILMGFLLLSGAAPAENDFKPAWWCRGAHFQTIVGGLFRPFPDIPLRTERLETPDGDFLDLDWLDAKGNPPLVVILHGLGGSARTAYIRCLLKEIQKIGWQAVCLNARGTTEPNRLPEMSHGGQTKDLDWVLKTVIERKTAEKIYLVGYSIGANQLLKWLGEKGAEVPQVEKAVAVSTPYNLTATVHNLDHGFNLKVYTHQMLKALKPRALEKERRFPGLIDKHKVEVAETFQVYDREVTARLGGFKDENDYWTQSSSEFYLKKIRRPVLLIHAQNDPFLPEQDLPLQEIKKSEYLHLLLTQDGGHLGFVSGNIPFRQEPWLERRILKFFKTE